MNNETLGQTAETTICQVAGLGLPRALTHRESPTLRAALTPVVRDALGKLPKVIRHVGLDAGEGGGQAKSAVDFILNGGATLSVKTTLKANGKVCPHGCGQCGGKTFDHYFGRLFDPPVTPLKFKRLCLTRMAEMLPLYLQNTFNCDYTIWIYGSTTGYHYEIIPQSAIRRMTWKPHRFTFSKDLKTWNESCTVRYELDSGDQLSLGEFQVHNNRSGYKFRWSFGNLLRVIGVTR